MLIPNKEQAIKDKVAPHKEPRKLTCVLFNCPFISNLAPRIESNKEPKTPETINITAR